jgi:ribonuclease III
VANLAALQESVGYLFKDEGLLRLALTHPSVAHEAATPVQHNQRLEFLGDAVLSLVLTHELYARFPMLGEGPLTKARAQMVNRRALAREAQRLGLGEHLVLSHGEESTGGRVRPSALADAYEALLGALFLDGGFEVVRAFILRRFLDGFGKLAEVPNLENPKGDLQEMLQAGSSDAPDYELISVNGPDHDRVFECAVHHAGVELGRGTGKSKKAAESAAALAALTALREKRTATTTMTGTEPPSSPESTKESGPAARGSTDSNR